MSEVRQGVPLPVRLVVILIYISVVLLSISGVLLIFNSASIARDEDISRGWVFFFGFLALFMAMFYAAVARGLTRGANSARLVVGIVTGILIASSIWQIILGYNEPGGIASIAFWLLIIWLLYGPSSSQRHFAPYAG